MDDCLPVCLVTDTTFCFFEVLCADFFEVLCADTFLMIT